MAAKQATKQPRRGEGGELEPPHDAQAERAVLSAVFFDNQVFDLVADLLHTPEVFYRPAHQTIWKHIQKLALSRTAIDVVTLGDSLDAEDQYGAAGGADYLIELAGVVGSAVNAAHHARIIHRHYLSREIIAFASALSNEMYSRPESVDAVESSLLTGLDGVLKKFPRGESVSGMALADAFADSFNDADTSKRIYMPYETARAFPYIDPGEFVVCGGYPGHGKTAYWWQAAIDLMDGFERRNAEGQTVFQEPVHVLFFSMEIGALQLAQRAMACKFNLSLSVAQGLHAPSSAESAVMSEAFEWLKKSEGKFEVVTEQPSVASIRAKILQKQAALRGQKLFVVVDMFQLVKREFQRGDNSSSAYERNADALWAIANTCKVPMVVLSSLSRQDKEDRRAKKPPTNDDLKHTQSLEGNAHATLFVYAPKGPDCNERVVIIGKDRQRGGVRAPIKYHWEGVYQSFTKPVEEPPKYMARDVHDWREDE